MMTDATWDTILEIMAIAVIADHRIRDPELIEFCHQAQRLNRLYFPDRILTRTALMKWFDDHKDSVSESMLSKDTLDVYLDKTLSKITAQPVQIELLRAVFSICICICDYEVDDEEAHVIKRAMDIWSLAIPSAADAEVA